MDDELVMRRTESGDLYTATKADWQAYVEAVAQNDWGRVQWMEEGNLSFKYTPEGRIG